MLFAGFIGLLTLQSCKEDCPTCQDPTNPECDNYDPCWDKKPVTADFYMYENHEGLDTSKGWEYYDTDTLLGQSVLLVAKEERELYWSEVTYTWIVGDETITGKDKKVITRNTFPSNTQIPVTLIVSKKPHLDCFPEDDGIDTVTRYMVFPSKNIPRWQGEFTGYTTGQPNVKLRIGIYPRDTATGSTSTRARLSGLPNGDCQWQQIDHFTFGYKQFQIQENSNFSCSGIRGLFRVLEDNKIIAKYTQMLVPDGDYYIRSEKEFIGKRIK